MNTSDTTHGDFLTRRSTLRAHLPPLDLFLGLLALLGLVRQHHLAFELLTVSHARGHLEPGVLQLGGPRFPDPGGGDPRLLARPALGSHTSHGVVHLGLEVCQLCFVVAEVLGRGEPQNLCGLTSIHGSSEVFYMITGVLE